MRWQQSAARAGAVIALVSLCACGRIGFDAGDGGAYDDAGSSDSRPPLPPVLLATDLTAGSHADVQAIAYATDGTLAVTGGYLGMLTIDGTGIASAAGSFLDAWVAVVGSDEHIQTAFSAGISSFGTGRGIGRDGTDLTLTGYFAGTAANVQNRTSGSGQDIFAAVISAGGTVAAAGNWGSNGNCQSRSLATRDGRIVVVGTYVDTFDFGTGPLPNTSGQDNGFIASFPRDLGTPTVRTLIAGSDVFPSDVAIGPDGSMCIAGRFSAATDFGGGTPLPSGGSSAFIVKYDANLNYQWATAIGNDALASSVTMLADGSCVATGQFFGTFDTLTSAGNYDAWVGRFNAADGGVAWLRGYGGVNADTGSAVRAIPGGDLLFIGVVSGVSTTPMGTITTDGGTDAFVARLGEDGSVVTQVLLGGTGDITAARAVAVTDDGSRVALGLGFTGNLVVADQMATTTESSAGAILFLPMLH